MTQQVFLTLLEQEVKSWPSGYILEEDSDAGYSPSQFNPVRQWKEANNVSFFFNCPHSPDLAPIENAWRGPKEELKTVPHWNDETVWEGAVRGWESLSQETINAWILSMPRRLKRVVEGGGKMTAY